MWFIEAGLAILVDDAGSEFGGREIVDLDDDEGNNNPPGTEQQQSERPLVGIWEKEEKGKHKK